MRPVFKRVLIIVLLFAVAMTVRYFYLVNKNDTLPIINPADIKSKEFISDSLAQIKQGHTIRDFLLINQNGDTITQQIFKNKIYVANFFFASCKTICPNMNGGLQTVYDEYRGDQDICFISHSSLPAEDTVPVLKAYAQRFGAQLPQWQFVTGNKKEIYDLARNFYLMAETKNEGLEYDFIHSRYLALIDTHKRIRGYYDGTSTEDVSRLIDDILLLKKENIK
ncbi:MAG: SCO family protein [Flavobacteriales bacterium]